jgi:hypothetical protein
MYGSKWGIYTQRPWPLSARGVFMADAIDIIGTAASVTWQAWLPTIMPVDLLPSLPGAGAAFTADRRPIADVHAAYADIIRSFQSPSAFLAEKLSRQASRRPTVFDPANEAAVVQHMLRAERGDDKNDDISYEHWDEVSLESDRIYEDHRGGISNLQLIGEHIQSAILASRLQSYIRPIGGSAEGLIPLDARYWEIDDPMPRLAWCGLDMQFPSDPDRPPTHWIFLDKAQLNDVASRLECILPLEEPEPEPKPTGFNKAIYLQVASFLIASFQNEVAAAAAATGAAKARSLTKKAEWLRQAEISLGTRISYTNWKNAWSAATAIYPVYNKAGRSRRTPVIRQSKH